MSRETMQWLNQHTLIGFTDKRGKAWHYRADEQGAEPNHYPGAIPVADVERRLFYWEPVYGDLKTTYMTGEGVNTITDPARQTVIRPDTETVLGVFGAGYRLHSYRKWLLEQVGHLLEDDLGIGSAGLLRGGAQAWVQVEVPENMTVAGLEYRPHLIAATSLDGSLATTYKRSVTAVVCDNTLAAALWRDTEQQFRFKHSRYSVGRLKDAREALGIVFETGSAFAEQVERLCAMEVKPETWSAFLDRFVPVTEDTKAATAMRAEAKREELNQLWMHDDRVAPWHGNAFGVIQAVNTHAHHVAKRRGDRGERNMSLAINGGFDTLDRKTFEVLEAVMA